MQSELKIEDIVLITGPDIHGNPEHAGERFTINKQDVWAGPIWFSGEGFAWYPASSLRKISKQPKTIADALQACSAEIGAAQEAVRTLLAPLVDKRLEGIEKAMSYQNDANDRLRKRCHDLEEDSNNVWQILEDVGLWSDDIDGKIDALLSDRQDLCIMLGETDDPQDRKIIAVLIGLIDAIEGPCQKK